MVLQRKSQQISWLWALACPGRPGKKTRCNLTITEIRILREKKKRLVFKALCYLTGKNLGVTHEKGLSPIISGTSKYNACRPIRSPLSSHELNLQFIFLFLCGNMSQVKCRWMASANITESTPVLMLEKHPPAVTTVTM